VHYDNSFQLTTDIYILLKEAGEEY